MIQPTTSTFCKIAILSVFSALPLLACSNYNYNNNNYQNDQSIYQFDAAERAKNNPSALYQYEQSMQGGLFAAYPAYWRLNKNLATQDSTSIVNFARQYQGTAIAEKLAADFAEEKARIGDYAAIAAIAPYVTNPDTSEKCALGFVASQSGAVDVALKEEVWLDTIWRKNPAALCEKLGSQMAYGRGINNTDRHNRLVRLMRIDNRSLGKRPKGADNTKGDIVVLANQLGLSINYGQLTQIANNPNYFFGQFNQTPPSYTNQYLYLYAISQLALRSYSQAITQLEYDIQLDNARPQRLLPEMVRRYAYRAIAMKRINMLTDDGFDKRAIDWFYKSMGEPFNIEESEGFARISAYYGDWRSVQTAISLMPQKNQAERVWQYWQARSLEGQGNKSGANQLYGYLANDLDYYGLLAKDRLGQRLSINDIGGANFPQANQSLVMSDPHFARAILLMQHNAKSDHINREWNWAVKKAKDAGNTELILNAAAIMHSLGNYSRSIYAMENSPAKNGALSHPTLHQNSYLTYSRNAGIDPAWAYGITRQESRFQANAKSNADAHGLMQLKTSTARDVAKSLGEPFGNLYNPDTNIRYGTRYLATSLNKLGGQIVPATAAYNAGSNPAQAWLPRQGAIQGDQFVEAIPYSETRDYVKNVMANTAVYGVMLGNPMGITQRMGNVGYR